MIMENGETISLLHSHKRGGYRMLSWVVGGKIIVVVTRNSVQFFQLNPWNPNAPNFFRLSSMIRKAIKIENISKCPFNDAYFLSSPLKWVTVEVAQLSKAYFYPKTLWKARKLHESFGCYCRQFMWHSLESVRFTDFIMIWTNHFQQQQQTFLISHPCFLMVWTKGGMIMLGVIPQPPNHPILPKITKMILCTTFSVLHPTETGKTPFLR